MKTWLGRLGRLLGRRELARQDREELDFHVEMFVAEQVRAGCGEAEARRRARLELGDPAPGAEALTDSRPGSRLESWLRDLAQAARGLRRAPVFACVAVLLVALGVSASTAIFTLVERVLLRPLPYPDAGSLVRVWEASPQRGIPMIGVARGNLAEWRLRARSFEGMAVSYTMGRTLTSGSDSEVVLAAQVTCDFFPLLGVAPRLGRAFSPEECRQARFNSAAAPIGADPAVMLGHGLWTRRFGADPAIVGRSVSLERRAFRVVGVMPQGFSLPSPGVEAFLAWELEDNLPRDQRYTEAFARLRPGADPAAAEGELRAIAARLAAEHPDTNRGWSVRLVPLLEQTTAAARPVLLVLLAAVALLLLIACGNLAILFLVRGSARAHEAALRLALGAGRGRLVRQFLMEALLVACAGGALGTLLAAAAVSQVPRLWPDLPRQQEVWLDGPALGFALAATLLAAALSGALPAWRAASQEPRLALRDGARTTGAQGRQLRDLLVGAEVALTVVLLIGAGLLVRSVAGLRAADPGFDARGVLVAPIFLDSQAYDSGAKSRDYYDRLFGRLRALPGVRRVGAATALPTSPLGPDFERPVWPAARRGDERAVRQAAVRMVTPEYFAALRIPIVSGRPFLEEDGPGTPRVVAVSQALARSLWPGESAVGKQLEVDYSTAGTYPYEVVGVVGDVRFRGPRSEPGPEVYFPHAQRPYLILNVAIRSDAEPAALVPRVREALHALDPRKPAQGVYRLSDLLGATFSRERQLMQLLVAFAAAAWLLSGLGVYGLLAYRVRQRGPEIGVRLALGASRARIAGWVASEAGRLLGAGAALGLATAALAGRLLSSVLYEVSPLDPATAFAALALLGLAGLLSAWWPAWQASRVDPAEILRRG